jgi:sugar lactone lactonase YvrE
LGVVDSDGNESWTSGLISEGQRFNDGTVDSLGRLVVGSMSLQLDDKSAENRLYLLNAKGELTTIREKVGLSNGLGVEPESGDLFHVDTLASTIHRIPLMSKSGGYGIAEVFHQFALDESPDGIVVLDSGEILVALWGQSALALIGTNGDEIGRVEVPPMFPTSLCICNDCGTLWMGSASQPREGANARILQGRVWSTPTAMRQTPNHSWRPVNMNLVRRR